MHKHSGENRPRHLSVIDSSVSEYNPPLEPEQEAVKAGLLTDPRLQVQDTPELSSLVRYIHGTAVLDPGEPEYQQYLTSEFSRLGLSRDIPTEILEEHIATARQAYLHPDA